ncbi:MAG TPA: hypothetical protein VK897_09945 [Anaerolineales bacterium]|nr:hypothetical protein [Anaerolineales bacterium]
MKSEWLNTPLITTLRWKEDDEKIMAKNPSTLDQNRREKTMNKRVGLWLDRNQAVIVSITDNIEGRTIIPSDMEHYDLSPTVVSGDGSLEERRNRRFWNHLGEYYDKIIAQLRDATAIQIFGPEQAKYELQKRLESEGLAQHIVSLEDAGPLTNLQIATKVRKLFPVRSQFDIF